MDNTVNYVPTERRAFLAGKKITVRHLTPVFTDTEEREHATQKVQAGLYRVFYKYVGKDAG